MERAPTRSNFACEGGALTLLIVCSMILLLVGLMVSGFFVSEVGLLDEPVHLLGGAMVADGLVPHVDFWSMYPPLDYYLVAGAFSVLGESVVAARVLQTLLYLLVLVALGFYFRLTSRDPGDALVLVFVAVYAIGTTFWYYTWNPFAIAFLALIAGLWALRRRANALAWVGVGCLTGAAVLSKLNYGGYVVIALGVALLGSPPERWSTHGRKWRAIGSFAFPVAAVIGAFAGFHASSLTSVLNQILWFPKDRLEPHRILSLSTVPQTAATLLAVMGPFLWITLRGIGSARPRRRAMIGFALAVAVGALTTWVGIAHSTHLPKVFYLTALVLIVCQPTAFRLPDPEFAVLLAHALFSHYFLSRADVFHYAPLGAISLLLAPYVRDEEWFPAPALSLGAILLVTMMAAGPTIFATASAVGRAAFDCGRNVWRISETATLCRTGDSAYLMRLPGEPTGLAAALFRDGGEIEAARYVHAHTAPDECVYVGLRDHASVFLSPARAYWVLGRPIGVRQYMLEPGLSTEADIQREMIADLSNRRVRWLILRENHPGDRDFERRGYRGADVLDRHLAEHFRSVRTFGAYTVFKKR